MSMWHCEKCLGTPGFGVGCVCPRNDQTAASAEPSVHEINREMTNAGWQNSGIRQADLPKVARVVRALLSRYGRPAGDAEYPQAAEVCAELYQVIGSLASDLGVFDHPKVVKALDNAADHALVHDDVLPFPSFEHKTAGDAQPVAWVAADTLNSPHPKCVSSLAYMSQIDQDRGREYVPLYAAPVAAQKADDARDAERWREWRRGNAITVRTAKSTHYLSPRLEPDFPECMDAAIDAAIAQQRQEES